MLLQKTTRLLILGCALIAAALLVACDPSPVPVPPSTPTVPPGKTATPFEQTTPSTQSSALVISPDVITFSNEQTVQSIFLASSPAGNLTWRITSKPDWLTVEPSSGVIDRDIVEVKVTAEGLATAKPGPYQGRIQIISAGGLGAVNVQAEVSANPALSLSPGILTFSESAVTNTLVLSNTGRGLLTWQVSSSDTAISVDPSSGELDSGKSASVTITANRAGLPVGTKPVTLTVKSNDEKGDVSVPVSVAVAANPITVASTSRLKFPRSVNQASFTLSNAGTGPLEWSAASADSWLSVSPSSGKLEPGANVQLSASVSRSGLPSGQANGSLTIKSNSASGDIVLAAAVASTDGATPGSLWVLDHRVVDAEYNPKTGLIVTISASPSRLNIIDPELGVVESVDLPAPPTSVAVRPDGAYAAVGHDALVTLVDLGKRSVERKYAITIAVQDVVLPNNGWVYAFPGALGIDLKTGVQVGTEGRARFGGPIGVLHPSGDYIYSPSVGISPSDVEKFDIRGGQAKLLYDSPYHGDYEFGVGSPGAGIWFSEDGTRMFTINGNIFRSSPVASEDMTYAGKLVGVSGIRSVATSTLAKKVLVLDGGSYREAQAPGLRVYDEEFLNFKGTVDLPTFDVPGSGSGVGAQGHRVFVNSTATLVYILVQADQSSGLAKDWAVATFEMSEMP